MEDITDRCDIIFHQSPPPPEDTDTGENENYSTGSQSQPFIMKMEETEPIPSTSTAAFVSPRKGRGFVSEDEVTGDTEEGEDDEEEDIGSDSEYQEGADAEGSDSGSASSSESDDSGDTGDSSDDDDDEWEETLVYVDLDEIPSVEELFAVEPDDFLNCQTKRMREQKKPKKVTHPEIELRFYNLDGANPVLQIGQRYYLGKFEDTFGTHLFFREKSSGSSSSESPSPLTKLTKDMDPPPDPVFSKKPAIEYELVANVGKVLKMTRQTVVTDIEKLRIINSQNSEPVSVPASCKKFGEIKRHGAMARTTTFKDVLAHKYVPRRRPDMNITKKDIQHKPIPGRYHTTKTDTEIPTEEGDVVMKEIEEIEQPK